RHALLGNKRTGGCLAWCGREIGSLRYLGGLETDWQVCIGGCRLVRALADCCVSMMLLVSAPRPSHFFFEMRIAARRKEEVTKKKARPASGPGCARVPSLHRRSRGPT